jgi:hypothetical protein
LSTEAWASSRCELLDRESPRRENPDCRFFTRSAPDLTYKRESAQTVSVQLTVPP